MNYEDLYVYAGDDGLQFLCKTRSTSFVYSQLDSFDQIPHVQVFFDKAAADSTSTVVKFIRMTSVIRSMIHVMCRGSMISTLSDDNVELHKVLIHAELHSAKALLDLDALCDCFAL